MIERIHLEIIEALDHHGTLTRAARALKLSQSALSHSIGKLEERLEALLWRKSGRTITLTPAGMQLLDLSRKTLPKLRRAEEVIKNTGRGEQGALRIGMECHPCHQWLLAIVPSFLKLWPHVDIDVKQRFQFGAIGALFAHEIDLVITPDPYYRRGLSFYPVFDYELVAVVHEHHGLCEKEVLRPHDLQNETLITYPVPPERLDIFTSFLAPAGAMPANHKCLETTEMILQMVAAKRGVAALPEWLVKQFEVQLPIKAIKLGQGGINKKTYLGIRNNDLDLKYIRGFIDLAKLQNQQSLAR